MAKILVHVVGKITRETINSGATEVINIQMPLLPEQSSVKVLVTNPANPNAEHLWLVQGNEPRQLLEWASKNGLTLLTPARAEEIAVRFLPGYSLAGEDLTGLLMPEV